MAEAKKEPLESSAASLLHQAKQKAISDALSDTQRRQQAVLSNTERGKLLKQIGLLAMVLAESDDKFKVGSRPNANAIAQTAGEKVDAFPNSPSRRGLGGSSIRESIKSGLDLLNRS